MKHAKRAGALTLAAALSLSMALPAGAASYTVQRGDSLWKIAKEQLAAGPGGPRSTTPTGTLSGIPT